MERGMKYLLISLPVLLSSCATINLDSVELSCSNLPPWATSVVPILFLLTSVGLIISEGLSLTEKIKANGIIQAVWLFLKSKLKKEPPKSDT
jgi:hypothetical protein